MIAKSCNETRFRLFWDALYKEICYNEIPDITNNFVWSLWNQLFCFVLFLDYTDITNKISWSQGPRYIEFSLYSFVTVYNNQEYIYASYCLCCKPFLVRMVKRIPVFTVTWHGSECPFNQVFLYPVLSQVVETALGVCLLSCNLGYLQCFI